LTPTGLAARAQDIRTPVAYASSSARPSTGPSSPGEPPHRLQWRSSTSIPPKPFQMPYGYDPYSPSYFTRGPKPPSFISREFTHEKGYEHEECAVCALVTGLARALDLVTANNSLGPTTLVLLVPILVSPISPAAQAERISLSHLVCRAASPSFVRESPNLRSCRPVASISASPPSPGTGK
jgi:hypothetical protein